MEDTKPLYHYTSQKGLIGILENQNVWMTNILYLNDSSEFTHTIDLVKSELRKRKEDLEKRGLPLIPNEKNLFDRYNTVERVLDIFLSEMVTESYVFSLSTKGNDLNQWRGYCPKEGGFSVQFDTMKLSSIIDNLGKSKKYVIKKCIYDERKKIELVKSLVDKIGDDKKTFYTELVDISSYIKHESFQDEQEYRIIYHKEPDEKKYRVGNSMIIPYIERILLDDDDKLPISKIIVGPTPHPELSKYSVESLLKSKGYDNIEVEKSNIPYRSW